MNRRVALRHAVSVPVRLGTVPGQSRDLSTRGVYFVVAVGLSVGSSIELELTLPEAGPSGPLHFRVTGRVVRVDAIGGGSGVAVEIDAWSLIETDE